jgi:hypothetical protein
MGANVVKVTKNGKEAFVVESAFEAVWEKRGWSKVGAAEAKTVAEGETPNQPSKGRAPKTEQAPPQQ